MAIPGKKLKAFVKKNNKSPVKGDEHDDEKGDEHEEKDDEEGADKEPKDKKEKKGKGGEPKVDVEKAANDADDHSDEEITEHIAGYDPDVDGNPPQWVEDEGKWDDAKAAVKPQWDNYDEPYAVVAYVYKQMGGTFKAHEGGGDED